MEQSDGVSTEVDKRSTFVADLYLRLKRVLNAQGILENTRLPYVKAAALLAASLVFAGAYYQWPLFSSNQNTYFLAGLAKAGYGHLSSDWLANQTDHIPAFSWIVSWVHTYAGHWMYYVLFFGLVAVYAASLMAIVARLYAPVWRVHEVALFVALLTLVHGAWMVGDGFEWFATFLTDGLAGQYILGPFLQPSAFGVLLIASLACFLYKREFAAIACAVIAGTVHPTYALHAGILTGAYMLVLVMERRPERALAVGALAALLILPIVVYVVVFLRPTDPLLLSEAQAILFEERFPHHAKISAWFAANSSTMVEAGLKLAIVVGGIVMSYRSRRLLVVLTFCAAVAFGLSLVQVLTGSRSLALLFPWRLSTWLIPVCSAILLGGLSVSAARAAERLTPAQLVPIGRASVVLLSVVVLLGSFYLGAKRTARGLLSEHQNEVLSYARTNARDGQTYLVPLKYEKFRLGAGIPVFVDWKSHPYRDVEVLEWHDRVQLATAFYQADSPDVVVRALAAIQQHAHVTHVIVKSGDEHLLEALDVQPLVRDRKHVLAELQGAARSQQPNEPDVD